MIKIKTVHSIDVDSWDEVIEKTYGRPYRLQQQNGTKSRGVEYVTVPCEHLEDYDYENDAIPDNGVDMGVSFAGWLARDPKQPLNGRSLDLFWYRNFYPSLEIVANDLHERGLLPAGEYQIVIDW